MVGEVMDDPRCTHGDGRNMDARVMSVVVLT
jgi:hypothetical protein